MRGGDRVSRADSPGLSRARAPGGVSRRNAEHPEFGARLVSRVLIRLRLLRPVIRHRLHDEWLLVSHPDHARLAGLFARAWGNDVFPHPEPIAPIVAAVARHDDAWAARDAAPELTRAGEPAAFSRELVGTYDAFEEIDFEAYLAVREAATEVVAADDPYAAILVSMHTVNLLTEQADLASLTAGQRAAHARFIENQLCRQRALCEALAADPALTGHLGEAALRRGFEFLQACDSLSLILCVAYPEPIALRHTHQRVDGVRVGLEAVPRGDDAWAVRPWPFREASLEVRLPFKRVAHGELRDLPTFRAAHARAPTEHRAIRLHP